jgi:hypothetical protein
MGLVRCPITGELIGPNDPQRKMVDLLGCASHSANTGAQARIDAVVKELEQKAAAHRKEAKRCLQPMLSARALGVEEAIALLKEGVGKC